VLRAGIRPSEQNPQIHPVQGVCTQKRSNPVPGFPWSGQAGPDPEQAKSKKGKTGPPVRQRNDTRSSMCHRLFTFLR
jgi:hypothetical protein